MSSRASPAATAAMAATSAPRGYVGGAVLRDRHLRAYRRMIVALYRVPASVALDRRFENPLDQLWQSLSNEYGPVLKPRLHARPPNVSAGDRRIAVVRGRLRRNRV